jgi:addiction module HigA family antidote
MNKRLDILKGLHPGLFLQRELDNRKLKSGQFAESIGEHPQTLSAIIRGRRSMNTPLSIRIEQALGLEEGFLMTLQVYYDIAEEKRKLSQSHRPDLTKFRPILFWDTTLDKIDFTAHSHYVINRVFERGTEEEIKEIVRFYGAETIKNMVELNSESPFEKIIRENLKKYISYEA